MTEHNVTIHRLTRMANFFLVVEHGELTLIDTGNKDSLDRVRSRIRETGHELEHIREGGAVDYLDEKLGNPDKDPHGQVIS